MLNIRNVISVNYFRFLGKNLVAGNNMSNL